MFGVSRYLVILCCALVHTALYLYIYRLSYPQNTKLAHGNSRSRTGEPAKASYIAVKCCVSSINMTTGPYSLQVLSWCCENERCVNGCVITFFDWLFSSPLSLGLLQSADKEAQECEWVHDAGLCFCDITTLTRVRKHKIVNKEADGKGDSLLPVVKGENNDRS